MLLLQRGRRGERLVCLFFGVEKDEWEVGLLEVRLWWSVINTLLFWSTKTDQSSEQKRKGRPMRRRRYERTEWTSTQIVQKQSLRPQACSLYQLPPLFFYFSTPLYGFSKRRYLPKNPTRLVTRTKEPRAAVSDFLCLKRKTQNESDLYRNKGGKECSNTPAPSTGHALLQKV